MRRLASTLTLCAALGLAQPGFAASSVGDLDLLSRANVLPNVMIILDNSGSMDATLGSSTRIEVAGDAVKTLIDNLYPDDDPGPGYTPRARLGLAFFDKSGSRNGGVIEIEIADDNKTELKDEVDDIVAWRLDSSSPGTGTPLSEALVDVGRYFAGQHGFGTYPAVTNDSPIDLECRENFVVMVTDGEPNDDENDHHGSLVIGTTAHSAFVNLIGNADNDSNECNALVTTCIDDPNDGRDDGFDYANDDGTDWLDDVAYYLAHNDLVPDAAITGSQIVKTYTIGFTTNIDLLDEAATNGLGDYLTATDATTLATALTNAFDAIFDDVSASFTSAVVPGATIGNGNAFFNSYFRSSATEPVWEGHLEMLRISPTGEIQDSALDPAVDSVTGDLLATRVPFWDAAIPLQTNTSRTLYTTKSTARVAFDTTNVTQSDLAIVAADLPTYPNNPASGVDTLPELHTAIVDYVHGKDAFDENNDASHTDMRPIVLGDIFHSTPRAIAKPTRFLAHEPGYAGYLSDYNTRDRVVYAGANDGLLHAFDAGEHVVGNDTTTPELEYEYYTHGTPVGSGDGSEIFGYTPGFLLDRLKEIPRNVPRSEFFVDGPIAVADAWVGDGLGADITKVADEWATVLIAAMREGGKGYLALDITDPDAVSGDPHFPYPSLMWEFSNATDADLGESWSEPVITRVRLENTPSTGDNCGIPDGDGDCREHWVAIFGGGYTATGDPNRTTYVPAGDAAWTDESKAIFMVSLDTGAVLAKVEYDSTGTDGPAAMQYSIPSSPAVLDLDFDGFADVVYVGDLGGQMWKWDISAVGDDNDADPLIDNWTYGRFFTTASTATSGTPATHYRSFFFPPVASYVNNKLVLSFGSGERHDLAYDGDASAAENNRFYVIADPNPTGVSAHSTTYTETNLTDITAANTDGNLLDQGYYFELADGEKFVTEVTVFAGHVIAGSYTPQSSTDLCATASGQSFLYIFSLGSGQGYFDDPIDPPSEDRRQFIGGGFPTSPEVVIAQDPNDDTIIIKTSEGPRVISVDAPPRTDPTGQLIYWKQQM
jgi:type IV pilus assembly protein PilY1